ncbi:MAG: hypothetical protein MJ201_02995 [Mycoplasmoidaceae bacterium]|nr:hypothetical protein [Mycoplasmoidaceae bacterium]
MILNSVFEQTYYYEDGTSQTTIRKESQKYNKERSGGEHYMIFASHYFKDVKHAEE